MNRKTRLLFIMVLTVSLVLSGLFTTPPAKAVGLPDQTQSTITATATTLFADNSTTTQVTFTAKDSTGAVVPGATVNWSPNPITPTATLTAGAYLNNTTNASGQVSITFKAGAADAGQNPSVTATVTSGGGVSKGITIHFTAPSPDANASTVSVLTNGKPADGQVADADTFQAIIKDVGNDPLGNITVTTTVTGPGTLSGLPASLTTTSNGTLNYSVTATVSGSYTVTLHASNPNPPGTPITLTQMAALNFVKSLPSASTSFVSASPTSANADGISAVTVTVHLLDSGNNPVVGIGGSLTPSTLNGLTITGPSQPGGLSDSNGLLTFTVTSTVAENVIFTAIANSSPQVTISNGTNANVNFGQAPPDKTQSNASASPTSVPADGSTFSTISVNIKDAGGHNLQGRTITVSPSSSVTFTDSGGSSVVTDANGNAVFTVTSTTASVSPVNFTVTDTSDNVTLNQIPQVTFTTPKADVNHSTLQVVNNKTSAFADKTDTISFLLTLNDVGNHHTPNKAVTIQASAGQPPLIVTPSSLNGTTDVNGQFTFTVASSTVGTYSFQINDTTDAVLIPASAVAVNFTQPPVNDALSKVVAAPHSVLADNTATSTITVTLKDAGGQAVNGVAVTLAASGGLPAGVSISSPNPATSSGGVATFTVKSSTVYAGVTFQATVTQPTPPGGTLTLSSTDTVGFTTPPATQGTITPATGSALANNGSTTAGQFTITVNLKDANGDPVSSKNVQLTFPNGTQGVYLPQPFNATGSGGIPGQATFVVGSAIAQSIAFTAIDVTDNFTVPGTSTITFTASSGPAAGANSTINVSPTTVNADGVSTTTVTVVARDQFNTVVQGATISLIPTTTIPQGGAGYIINSVQPTTDNTGTAKFTVSSGTAGTISFAATDGSGFISNTPPGGSKVVTFNPVGSQVDATNSTIAAAPTVQTADGVSTITITVTVKKIGGGVITGANVTLNISGPAAITPVVVTNPTDINGQAKFTIATNTPGVYTVGAAAGSPATTLAATVQVTFNPAGCAAIVAASNVTISPTTSQPADGTTAFTVTVTSTASLPLSITTSRGGVDTFAPVPSSTGTGTSSYSMTSTTAGTGNVLAKVNGCILTQQPAFTWFSPSSGIDPTKSSVDVQAPTSQPADNTSLITVTVTLRDSSNFLVTTSQTVTLNIAPSSGITVVTNPVTTTSGTATFTVKSSVPGTFTASATVGAVTITRTVTNGTPTLTFTALPGSVDPTKSSVVLTGSPASVGGNITVTVTLHDTSNNAVNGKTVTLSSPTGGGTSFSPSTATTAGGVATFTLTSTAAGSFNVTALDSTDSISLNAPTQAVFQNVAASATNSFIQASPNSVAANGSTTATVTVTLHDASNNPVANKNVTLIETASVSTANLIGGTTGTTNGSGQVSFGIASTVAQTVSFTATDTSDSISVTNTGGGSNLVVYTATTGLSTTNSTATASSSTVPADGTTSVTITVHIATVGGASVPGATVNLFANPSTGVVASPSTQQTTDASGNVTFLVRSTAQGTVTFTVQATANGQTITLANQPTVTFGTSTGTGTISCPNSSISSNYSSFPINSSTGVTITAIERNSSNVGVSGQAASLSANPATGVTISPTSTVTDANGNAVFNVKSSAMGSIVFTVTSGSCVGTVTVNFTAANTAPVASGTSTTTQTGGGTGAAGTALIQPPNAGPATGIVIAYRLRVRTGPGLTYHILGLLKYKTVVVLTARNPRGTWFQIRLTNGTAWVSAYWIRVKRLDYRHLPIIQDFPPAPNDTNIQAVIPK